MEEIRYDGTVVFHDLPTYLNGCYLFLVKYPSGNYVLAIEDEDVLISFVRYVEGS